MSLGFSGVRVSGLGLDGLRLKCRILSSELRKQVPFVAGLGGFC